MPTAEGTFPKIAGDPLYASEVNLFNPKVFGFVEQDVGVNISGTTAFFNMGGSLLYPGNGSLRMERHIIVLAGCSVQQTGGLHTLRLRLSGTAGINMTTASKISSNNTGTLVQFCHLFTSGVITASGGNIGSPYAIFLEGNSNIDNTNDRAENIIGLSW